MTEENESVELATTEIEDRILSLTRGNNISALTVEAWNILERGEVPQEAIKTVPGKNVPYADHKWGTRLMNAAFGWTWEFNVLQYSIDPHDGSATALCEMTMNVPYRDKDGNMQFFERKITEIGSFEAYQKSEDKQEVEDSDNPKLRRVKTTRVMKFRWDGSPEYTMSASDRIASAASRGLMKCIARATNIGMELGQSESVPEDYSPKKAYNTILRYFNRHGLTKEEVDSYLKNNGFAYDELPSRFNEAWGALDRYLKEKSYEVPEL